MKRNLNKLANQHFDLLIIGGGIHGAAIAREAAISGLKTALIEQNDFSSATSGSSLKILHGGFRYLKDFDLKRMKISKKSQIEFNRIAPHLVSPLACAIPTYGYGLRGKPLMRFALFINDLIGVENLREFGRGKIISKEDFAKIVDEPVDSYVNGAAVWYDALAQDTERLTITLLIDAAEKGACIANYVKVTKLLLKDNCVIGVCAKDSHGEDKFEIRSQKVVNATGPWMKNLLNSLPNCQEKESRLARGLNIIVKRCLFHDYAVGLEGGSDNYESEDIFMPKKRFFFFVPWHGKTMIGTSYKAYQGNPDKFRLRRQDIEEFLREINQLYPPAELKFKDVTFFHAGLIPLTEKSTKVGFDLKLAKREVVIDHEKKDGIKGLLSVRSVKYTTAPFVAQKVMKKLGVTRKKKGIVQRTKGLPNSFSNENFPAGFLNGDSDEINSPSLAAYLTAKYGACAARIEAYIAGGHGLARWISREPKLIAAEVLYAIREEMALHLSDVVFRRTGFGNVACPSRKNLEALTDIMAKELGWTSKQKVDEIFNVFKSYHPLPVPATIRSSTGKEADANFDN
jgi:glycerol-3-phosphate dehydrogenase